MLLLPFDSHNHVHLGSSIASTHSTTTTTPWSTVLPLFQEETSCCKGDSKERGSSSSTSSSNDDVSSDGTVEVSHLRLSGMAIMSTNPSDFVLVKELAIGLNKNKSNAGVHIIPCFGLHPWWVHELTDDQWELIDSNDIGDDKGSDNDVLELAPRWVHSMERTLLDTPGSVVGEIGLDGYHYDPITKLLTCPMEKQILAFQYQMKVAYKLNRPVSIHAVQCFGSLLQVLFHLKQMKQLPNVLYFHAFGGKVGTIDQILALCGNTTKTKNIVRESECDKSHHNSINICYTEKKKEKEENQQQEQHIRCRDGTTGSSAVVYFGFAPVVNFRSPKTATVIRRVGIHRIVLETDHEEVDCIVQSIYDGIVFISDALGISQQEVIDQTTKNAYNMYGIS